MTNRLPELPIDRQEREGFRRIPREDCRQYVQSSQTLGKFVQNYSNEPSASPVIENPSPWKMDEYLPNDCSVGDLDGDGEYEIIVNGTLVRMIIRTTVLLIPFFWMPTNWMARNFGVLTWVKYPCRGALYPIYGL